jgi:Family of unknown function (DUF5677)
MTADYHLFMTTTAVGLELADATKRVEYFYSILKSIHEYSISEIKGVLGTLISPSLEEQCYVALYYRTWCDVESLLALKNIQHFQALGMLARALYELSVDLELITKVENAPNKMGHFTDIEKLRGCKQMAEFAKKNPLTELAKADWQDQYVQMNEVRIEKATAALWPGVEMRKLTHWSGLSLRRRVFLLDTAQQEMYEFYYRQLSWNVHSGLEGVIDLDASKFADKCGMSYYLAAVCYQRTLLAIIGKFHLSKHDPLLANKLEYARHLPNAKDEAEAIALRRHFNA